MDVLRTLERYCFNDEPRFGLRCSGNDWMKSQQDDTNTSPAVTILIDPTKDHPGAGACIVDNALSEQDLQQLERLSGLLPVASCESADDLTATAMDDKMQYRPTRSYFCDSEQIIQGMLQKGIDAARNALSSQSKTNETSSNVSSTENLAFNTSRSPPPSSVFHHLRFLRYEQKGGLLPPHVDLCRVDESSGHRSTHTFILYLTNCSVGGGTALLKHLNDPKVLAVAQPKRGRALIFPHLCPHSGLEVDSVPKVLLRGEVIL
jgi:hypothetical protein